jgi:hypothetical protein
MSTQTLRSLRTLLVNHHFGNTLALDCFILYMNRLPFDSYGPCCIGAYLPLAKTGSGDSKPSLVRLGLHICLSTPPDKTVVFCLSGRKGFYIIYYLGVK